MALKVFISYSRKDSTRAREVRDALHKTGVACFLDESSIAPGQPFPETIAKAIRTCSALIVLLSANVTESSWVEAEIREARFANKWLVPYRIDSSDMRPEILPSHLQEVRSLSALLRAIAPRVTINDISTQGLSRLEVPGVEGAYSSFHPVNTSEGSMFRLQIPTTDGWIPDIDHADGKSHKIQQTVYLIRDPIRQFEIQIGEMRSLRPGGVPGAIELDSTVYDKRYLLGTWNQLIRNADKTRWERAVLSEVAPDPELLREMYESESDHWIRSLIGKNPATPEDIKKKECLFCDPKFLAIRRRFPKQISPMPAAVIINNDYPFGPHFHYIAIPTAPVHSWDSVEVEHLLAMNEALVAFLKDPQNTYGAAGLRVGFNSSVRHLVAGATTRASAGASISHIHKQAWGMEAGSFNLGDHLALICEAYKRREGIDYLDCYLNTLRQARMIIAEDRFIALYVPLGQIATHELQIMIKNPRRTFLDLDYDELKSLSFAELGVAKLYAALGINSYNEIVISQRFESPGDSSFRVIVSFVTREIDLAVSELNLLFVTDKHPYDTVIAVDQHWADIVRDNSLPFDTEQ